MRVTSDMKIRIRPVDSLPQASGRENRGGNWGQVGQVYFFVFGWMRLRSTKK
jgi:hypothetical protein